eukprot:m.830638 g.830638  ORF g.830638 m.830638 type:complete len:476 (+) comp23425_c0_seq59:220-1647(+)
MLHRSAQACTRGYMATRFITRPCIGSCQSVPLALIDLQAKAGLDRFEPQASFNYRKHIHTSSTCLQRYGKLHGALPEFIDDWNVKRFYQFGAVFSGMSGVFAFMCPTSPFAWTAVAATGAYWIIGARDMNQTSHTIRRNFPVLGNLRYILESIRPEIRQYFIEADTDKSGVPFDRAHRNIAYQRAKAMSDTVPLGTKLDVYDEGYSWVLHSLWPKTVTMADARIVIGGMHCKQPYSASLLNISGMSYGALSNNAILALNKGALMGNFYHNTGEGGISRFHKQHGGDLVWNIGTMLRVCQWRQQGVRSIYGKGYFACRNPDGTFSEEKFCENAKLPAVKMIELKLSQGAKPGHGGLLPKEKISMEIAEARGLDFPPNGDCNSPPLHTAFTTPLEFVHFLQRLRELSGGKPIGFKLYCFVRVCERIHLCGCMCVRVCVIAWKDECTCLCVLMYAFCLLRCRLFMYTTPTFCMSVSDI